MSPSSHGTLRVNRDIVVKRVDHDELHVISREPGVRDERMLVQFPDEDSDDAVRVRVLDSKPIVVQGAVRHLLRLHVVGASAREDDGDRVATSQEGGSIDG